jgi:hypothetical protein
LGRPQGITSPSLYCPPDTYQWRVFEGLLDMWFSRRFAVQITGGPDLVFIDSGARPSMISRKSGELTATIVGTRVKIGQLNNAKITLRIDKSVTERNELFVTVRLKSLDPLVEFDKKVDAKWTPTKIGTEKIALDVADDPQDVDIVVLTAGPMPLPVRVDPRLLAVENERPRK